MKVICKVLQTEFHRNIQEHFLFSSKKVKEALILQITILLLEG